MKKSIVYNGQAIEYSLNRSGRKTIGISIRQGKGVYVNAPFRVSDTYIKSVVVEKAEWILKKLKEINDEVPATREYATGDTITILGEEYQLHIKSQAGLKKLQINLSGKVIDIAIPDSFEGDGRTAIIKEALSAWMKNIAHRFINERIKVFSERLGVVPNKIFLKAQKTIWGSCTRENNININWRIIMAPEEIVDYLVVHELAHIKVKNHSKAYWNIVQAVLPDHAERRKWLRVNGHRLYV